MNEHNQATTSGEQTAPQIADAAGPMPLDDATLDNASGGIIAILIGLATQPKIEPAAIGDGSVRPSSLR